MEQKEHINTLCALGTVGAATAGLVFGTDNVDSSILRPGKRKWPGSSGPTWSMFSEPPALPPRSVSHPIPPIPPSDSSTTSSNLSHSKRFSSTSKVFMSNKENILLDQPSSRGSSTSRRSILRPKTATSRSTMDIRDSGSSSSWLKRLSSFSSHSTSSAVSNTYQEEPASESSAPLSNGSSPSAGSIPNKLVKRSVSQRGLSHVEAGGQILRRPATSHQRSQILRDMLSRPVSHESAYQHTNVATSAPQTTVPKRPWRPFFESSFPRKRRRSDTATDASQIRVISVPSGIQPVMLLGSELGHWEPSRGIDDLQTKSQYAGPPLHEAPLHVRKSRRSLSSLRRVTSRRRNVTEPALQSMRAATINTPAITQGSLLSSPKENGFPYHSPHSPASPHFTSSPPLSRSRSEHLSSSRTQDSLYASDHPTTSSDAEGRVFSDTGSIEFRSDTAYDSIATRATDISLPSGVNTKLETIFASRTSDEAGFYSDAWRSLGQEEVGGDVNTHNSPFQLPGVEMRGIGISLTQSKQPSITSTMDDAFPVTPPKSISSHAEDVNATPVPLRASKTDVASSSPPLLPLLVQSRDYDRVGEMLADMKLDDDNIGGDITWSVASSSPLSASLENMSAGHGVSPFPTLPHPMLTRFQESEDEEMNNASSHTSSKQSVWDWSENQQVTSFSRPKTVHGKQGSGDRSRSSGRKVPTQLHFRSQSVPVNREGSNEDLPVVAKYQTWRLGQKPISEEWSDDFEFDDVEETNADSPIVDAYSNTLRDSIRSVRIPQAIIDRQPSVHLQFGQVQEFMALVEELKRLRSKGTALQIVNGNAKYLWEDAENIINLATMNDEEDHTIASSPTSSDPFAEVPAVSHENLPSTATNRGRRTTISSRRSVSTTSGPAMHGRARGESLAQARHFLQAMHEHRNGIGSSPKEIEIHKQKKLPFDTQDLKDLVVRSGVITRALKEEIRKAEGVPESPQQTPPSSKHEHALNELFRAPEAQDASSPCPPFRKPTLPKSRSANSYLEHTNSRKYSGPFSSPISLATVV